jgi:transmembrane sensor
MKQFKSNEELLYTLIIEDLDNTISPEQKIILDSWRNMTADNERMYQGYKEIQLNLERLYTLRGPDAQRSWEALDKKIDAQDVKSPVAIKSKLYTRVWFQIAAAVLVILCLLPLVYYNRLDTVENGNNAGIKRIVLPDGTEVSLNASTRIKYRHNFMSNRELKLLEGEVFIHVKSNAGRQFKVKIDDVEALDIGTSFNVSKTENNIAVIVEEGQVALKHRSSDMEVLLSPGKMGIYDVNTKQLSTGNNQDINYKSWIDKKFVFNAVPVAQVADQLEKAYKVPVVIEGMALRDRKLTARLHYQTLDSALAVISASLECKVTKGKDAYVLSAY